MHHDQCCLKEWSQVSHIPEQYQYYFPTWEHFTVITSYYINKRSVLSLDMTYKLIHFLYHRKQPVWYITKWVAKLIRMCGLVS